MKLSATVSALIISALASSSGAEARTSGSRRSVQLGNDNGTAGSSANLVKRVSLAQMQENSSSMKKMKRQPLAAPIAAAAGFGSIPSINDGNMPIVGMSKRQHSFDEHNGKQGTALTSSNTVTSGNKSGSSAATSSDSNDANAEECEEDEEDDEDCQESNSADDDDDEECEEDDSVDADDEDCEEDDDSADADAEECDDEDDGDNEDCTEEEEDDSATSSSSTDDTAAAATANVNVNLKQSTSSTKNSNNGNKDNKSTASSSSKSADASKTSSSASSKATESSSSADGENYKGTATWYTQNGNAGACGTVNPDSAKIIALYTSAYGGGDNCGRSVMIKNLDDGTQTTATVADMCPSCGGPQDIDLSVGAFEAIDPEYQTHGVRNIEWYFTD